MENTRGLAARVVLRPFRALWLAEGLVGAPFANRVLARPYRSVPGRLLDWRSKRRLRVDDEPAFHLYEYTAAGVSVRGVVANLELKPAEGVVFPHEGVHPGQVAQLARRMRVMAVNPAPILLVHEAVPGLRGLLDEVAASPADRTLTDRSGQLHRIWRITGPGQQDALASALADQRLIIADGHHRYAAAWQLHREEPDTAWDCTLVMLIDAEDAPLQLGAIHRSVRGVDLATVAARAPQLGATYTPQPDRAAALAELHEALVLHDGTAWGTLRPAGAGLLVRTLHEELLPAWGAGEGDVSYHHSAGDALAASGGGLAVLLPAPTFQQVAAAAVSGDLLPHKATSFQPKPNLGALMRDLRDG